jgi:hypothetical protein
MQDGVQYPNQIFVANFIHENEFGKVKYTIILAAKNNDTARKHLKTLFGIEKDLILLVNSGYQTIYDQTGKEPLEVQAKILFHTHVLS